MKFSLPQVDKQPQLSLDHPVNGFDFGLLFFLMLCVNIGVAARKEFIIEMENCLIADFHMQISVVNRTQTHTHTHATRGWGRNAQSRRVLASFWCSLAYRVHPSTTIKSHVTFSYQLVTSEYTWFISVIITTRTSTRTRTGQEQRWNAVVGWELDALRKFPTQQQLTLSCWGRE